MDPIAVYKERSPGLNRTFSLFPEKLVIQGHHRTTGSFQTTVNLDSVQPEFGYTHTLRGDRFVGYFFGLILGGLGCFIHFGLDFPVDSPRVITCFVLAFASLIVSLILQSYRILVYQFQNAENVIVLNFLKSGPEKENCLLFVETVQERILAIKKEQDQSEDQPCS